MFRALGHRDRRMLLDQLRRRDGQSLVELTRHLDVTRFGVMKHLRVLEGAHLVTTKKVGRERLHYLNPVPIRQLHDRWISKYAEPWAVTLSGLKRAMEEGPMAERSAPRHVYTVYVRATPERLWAAITDPEATRRYYYGTLVQSDWQPGSAMRYVYPNGSLAADGEILEIDPPRRLVHTFDATWDDEVKPDRRHRVTWEIERLGSACRLTVEHSDFDGETATYRSVASGLSVILSGLKTYVETGEPLEVGR